MSLQAAEFFAEMCLPFHDHTVVGNAYLAVPVPGAPLRLRIDFSRTIHADTYGGLRVAVVHPDRGEIDAVALSFLDHGTFHRRDEATNARPSTKRYGTFGTHHRPGRPPWDGAVTTGLRDAIQQYSTIWFPGAWTASAPRRPAGHTPRSTPVPQAPLQGPTPVEPSFRSPANAIPRSLPRRSLSPCCPTRPSTPSATSAPTRT